MSGFDPVFEDVEVFCAGSRRHVTLSLRVPRRVCGDVVDGVPVSCSFEASCSGGVKCMLKHRRVCTTRRKLK